MRHPWFFPTAAALFIVLVAGQLAIAQPAIHDKAAVEKASVNSASAMDPSTAKVPIKEVLIPASGGRNVPENNDYDNPESEFCHQRSKSTDNFILFWAKEYGEDPMANEDARRRFDVNEILKESERFFDYYVNTLKWVDKEKSFATRYKFLIYIFGGAGGTAYGGAIDNKIGAFWSPATRVNRGPYGVVAHELGHSFQAIGRADGAERFSGGSIGEMGAQYMLWQVYPEWMTFENYHLRDFMQRTHLAFLHPDNQYHSCYPIEYWSNKHGVELFGRMWREVKRGEDPVMTYKRLTSIRQEQFNDEMFDACRRFVTWDMPRIEKVAARYANQHTTMLNTADDGWFQIAADKCPQNYGYNAIKLKVPATSTKVTLDFKGIVGAEGFKSYQPERAGWRYGFLASLEDGSRVYSDVFSKPEAAAEFSVPANTKFLWLVVMGAPSEHWIHVSARGGGRGRGRGRGGAAGEARGGQADATRGQADAKDAPAEAPPNTTEQWPYRFKLTGTAPDDSIVQSTSAN
ncbi:MAG TPA: DUF6055 domain-containing protein [Candidatus Limnocylindria bacterium]|nr:DUF6055 domain-containing protein [Candidatus Limnocylindria bacterium]